MKKEKLIVIIISISIVFMAWWPIKPSTTLADKNIKGPVEIIIENLKAGVANNIVVQKYNHFGNWISLSSFKNGIKEDSVSRVIIYNTENQR